MRKTSCRHVLFFAVLAGTGFSLLGAIDSRQAPAVLDAPQSTAARETPYTGGAFFMPLGTASAEELPSIVEPDRPLVAMVELGSPGDHAARDMPEDGIPRVAARFPWRRSTVRRQECREAEQAAAQTPAVDETDAYVESNREEPSSGDISPPMPEVADAPDAAPPASQLDALEEGVFFEGATSEATSEGPIDVEMSLRDAVEDVLDGDDQAVGADAPEPSHDADVAEGEQLAPFVYGLVIPWGQNDTGSNVAVPLDQHESDGPDSTLFDQSAPDHVKPRFEYEIDRFRPDPGPSSPTPASNEAVDLGELPDDEIDPYPAEVPSVDRQAAGAKAAVDGFVSRYAPQQFGDGSHVSDGLRRDSPPQAYSEGEAGRTDTLSDATESESEYSYDAVVGSAIDAIDMWTAAEAPSGQGTFHADGSIDDGTIDDGTVEKVMDAMDFWEESRARSTWPSDVEPVSPIDDATVRKVIDVMETWGSSDSTTEEEPTTDEAAPTGDTTVDKVMDAMELWETDPEPSAEPEESTGTSAATGSQSGGLLLLAGPERSALETEPSISSAEAAAATFRETWSMDAWSERTTLQRLTGYHGYSLAYPDQTSAYPAAAPPQ